MASREKIPVPYSEALGAAICVRLAAGESLRAICAENGMPDESAVRLWARERDDFAPQYARARAAGYEVMADEIVDISDDSTRDTIVGEEGEERQNSEWLARSRLRVDTRKWILSKMLPKVYGDKQQVEHSGGLTLEQIIGKSMEPAAPDPNKAEP